MIDKQIDSLPVIGTGTEELEIVGRITKTNITAAFLTLAQDHEL